MEEAKTQRSSVRRDAVRSDAAQPDATRRDAVRHDAVSRGLSAKRERLDGMLVIALSRSYEAAHRRSKKLVADYGLTFTQFEVMEALLHKGPLTVNAIIEAVLSTGGNITVVVRNLEKRGYVSRSTNPEDGRSFIVVLTDEGRAIIEEVFPRHMRLLDEALADLSDKDIETIVGLLKKVERPSGAERKA